MGKKAGSGKIKYCAVACWKEMGQWRPLLRMGATGSLQMNWELGEED